ncbi:MAG: hypothetical protein JW716_03390 [Candidatus Aenigmarchaeota archaeon]|nr:hypothetical protein [Candidatus Aenigmarchaeota archaeon]
MDAFGVFKIVLGLVISAFILIAVLNFAGSYMDINASKKQVSDLKAFERSVGDAYVNGIPSNYSFDNEAFSAMKIYNPPLLVTEFTNIDFGFVPFFFKSGRAVSISRMTEDTGWWRFDYIVSLPKTRIVFIPVKDSSDVEETVKLISSALPDTENVEPNILFGFGCEDVSYFILEKWTRDKFIKDIIPYMKTMVDFEDNCIGSTGADETIIYISDEMTEFEKGILVVTSGPYWGHIYTNTSGVLRNYTYKDGMDIMAFSLGGPDFYIYKNDIYLKQLRAAAKLKMDETGLLGARATKHDCTALYSVFSGILQQIYDSSGSEYNDDINAIMLAENLRRSIDFYKILEESGCA